MVDPSVIVVTSPAMWLGFNLFVAAMLALDLGVFHRHAHAVKLREALSWTAVWIALALCFNIGVYYWHGRQAALEFLTGYLIEKSLSVDNIFVFLLIFSYFKVPGVYQHKILFWGILGALILRAAFILAGVTPGQGCIIERHPDGIAIREMPAAIANHWVSLPLRGRVRGRHSRERLAQMQAIAGNCTEFTPEAPIINRDTRVVTLMHPAAGRLRVQGWERGQPVTAELWLDLGGPL